MYNKTLLTWTELFKVSNNNFFKHQYKNLVNKNTKSVVSFSALMQHKPRPAYQSIRKQLCVWPIIFWGLWKPKAERNCLVTKLNALEHLIYLAITWVMILLALLCTCSLCLCSCVMYYVARRVITMWAVLCCHAGNTMKW